MKTLLLLFGIATLALVTAGCSSPSPAASIPESPAASNEIRPHDDSQMTDPDHHDTSGMSPDPNTGSHDDSQQPPHRH